MSPTRIDSPHCHQKKAGRRATKQAGDKAVTIDPRIIPAYSGHP
jgi:hypothetical protein